MIRYLSRDNVEQLAVSGTVIADAIEVAIRAEAVGAAENVPKSGVQLADGRLFQSVMAVGIDSPAPPYAATKVVGLSPNNHEKGLPHIGSVIVLLDAITGIPCSIMDGSWITEMRTAALSLVVARKFARPESSRIGFIACGAQARSHLAVFKERYPLSTATAYSRRRDTAELFAEHARSIGLKAVVTIDPKSAVENQDIVITSVPHGPETLGFLDPNWIEPGAYAALVDLGRSWQALGLSGVEHRIVDNRLQAEKSAKTRGFNPPGPYTLDLGEMIAGSGVQEKSPGDRALFVFQGLALADLAAAALVYEQAVAGDIGLILS